MRHHATFSYIKSFHFLNHVLNDDAFILNTDKNKNSIIVSDRKFNKLLAFHFPLVFNLKMNDYIETKNIPVQKNLPESFLILIHAGQAALAVTKGREIALHKVIRKYMVRKKQGKAQINYLKTKGKSRAGSRVRLADSADFFEEINLTATKWLQQSNPQSIIYHCSPVLWGYLFRAKNKPPFEKKDIRLKKVPLDVNRPTMMELKRTANYLQSGHLDFFDGCPAEKRSEIIKKIAGF